MRMIDREKIITALEQVKDEINPVSGSRKARLRDAVDDAIALLKEQPEIVRCKECKNCEYPDSEKEWCKKGHLHGNAKTWFCADGERRDSDG